jgi:DNA polymerase III sliding clamp (beta) subunit (PCNA family)
VDILKNHKKFVDKLYKIDSHRDDDNFETILYLGEESLKLKSGHEDFGTLEDEIPVKMEKSGFSTKEICINTKFLLEGSSEVYGDTVTLKIQSEINPVVITGGSFTSVAMPVRIKK